MPTPHSTAPVLHAGPELRDARFAAVLVHGRGASARDILGLGAALDAPELALVAPQADDHAWYPYSFLEPHERNQPHLDGALLALERLVGDLETAGIPPSRIVLAGFSQGACLASEFAARNARRYGALLAFSGGLIGPEGTPREYEGSLDGTPVFLGCSDVDAHIPVERVHETAEVLERLGANVTKRIYPGMAHTINDDELEHAREIVRTMIDGNQA